MHYILKYQNNLNINYMVRVNKKILSKIKKRSLEIIYVLIKEKKEKKNLKKIELKIK